jgi:hypothetical protein
MRFSVGFDLEFGMDGWYTNGTSKIEGSMLGMGYGVLALLYRLPRGLTMITYIRSVTI